MVTKERSYIMSRIKSKDTTGERVLGGALEALGVYFERWGNVFGKPDFLVPEQKIAVFMDGCFWHKHAPHFKLPKTRRAFWKKKLDRNAQRDREVNDALNAMGYRVFRFWECEVKRSPVLCAKEVASYVQGLDPLS